MAFSTWLHIVTAILVVTTFHLPLEPAAAYPAILSPDGVDYYDYDSYSASHHRVSELDLSEGMIFADVIEPCEREGKSRHLGECLAPYERNPRWEPNPTASGEPRTSLVYHS